MEERPPPKSIGELADRQQENKRDNENETRNRNAVGHRQAGRQNGASSRKEDSALLDEDSARQNEDSARRKENSARLHENSARQNENSACRKENSARQQENSARLKENTARLKENSNASAAAASSFGVYSGQLEAFRSLCALLACSTAHAETFRDSCVTPPSGLLLYGPPGCGKTHLVSIEHTHALSPT